MLVPAATLGSAAYAAYRVLNPRQIPPVGGLMDNAVEGGAQQSVIALFSYLIVNFTQQFVESNLAGYLVENIRDNDPFFIRTRWSEWTRMLMEQVLAYSTQNQPLFPDPTEIPLTRLTPRQVAEALLSYFEGFARNREQNVIDALRRYLGEQQPQGVVQTVEREVPINDPKAKGDEGTTARAMSDVGRDVDAYLARYSRVAPSRFTTANQVAGVALFKRVYQEIDNMMLRDRKGGFNPSGANRVFVPTQYDYTLYQYEQMVELLNAFVLDYGDALESLGLLDYASLVDLLIRVFQSEISRIRREP